MDFEAWQIEQAERPSGMLMALRIGARLGAGLLLPVAVTAILLAFADLRRYPIPDQLRTYLPFQSVGLLFIAIPTAVGAVSVLRGNAEVSPSAEKPSTIEVASVVWNAFKVLALVGFTAYFFVARQHGVGLVLGMLLWMMTALTRWPLGSWPSTRAARATHWGAILLGELLLVASIIGGLRGRIGWTELLALQDQVASIPIRIPQEGTLLVTSAPLHRSASTYLVRSDGGSTGGGHKRIVRRKQPFDAPNHLTYDDVEQVVWMAPPDGGRALFFDLSSQTWMQLDAPVASSSNLSRFGSKLLLSTDEGLFARDVDDDSSEFVRLKVPSPRGPVLVDEGRVFVVTANGGWLSSEGLDGFEDILVDTDGNSEGLRVAALNSKYVWVFRKTGLLGTTGPAYRHGEKGTTRLASPCRSVEVALTHPRHPEWIAIGCSYEGVWLSRNAGATFESLGMEGMDILGLSWSENGRGLIAGTHDFLFRAGPFFRVVSGL